MILEEPNTSIKKGEILQAYKKYIDHLTKLGINPRLHILNN